MWQLFYTETGIFTDVYLTVAELQGGLNDSAGIVLHSDGEHLALDDSQEFLDKLRSLFQRNLSLVHGNVGRGEALVYESLGGRKGCRFSHG